MIKAKDIVFRERISCNHTRNENGEMILSTALAEGGVVEYRNGEKGVRLKCGWWMRVLPISEYGQPPKEKNPKPYKASKKDLAALAKIKEQHGDDWDVHWMGYCYKKIFK